MSDGVNDPRQEALGELALAALALDEHDAEHAVRHLGAALGHDPRLPEAHELLAKLAARADDGGLALFHPGERATAGRVVAYAHVLARHGRHADALALLAQATVHDPARPWADVSWVQALDPAGVAPESLLRVLLSVLGALPDPAPAHLARANRPYLDLARRTLLAHPGEALLHGAASGVARRLRELPLALAWAERGVRLQSSKLTEMWWGNALRADGRLDAAVQAMRAAQRHDPDDLSVASDLALWLTELGHTAEALALIEEATAKDPSYDCAVHTAHRLRFLADGDPGHLIALADFMRATTDASHEHHDLQQCCERLPWLGFVPEDGEPLPPAGLLPDPPQPAAARAVAAMLPLGWAPPPMTYDAAVRLAGVPTEDLIAALSHPPVPAGTDPDRVPAARRVLRLWCCLGLLHHRASEPWFGSTRRRLLLDVALGAGEGSVEALYALVAAAWVDPACRADVAALLEARLRAVPPARRIHPFTADVAVAQLAHVTPDMPAAARTLAREITGDLPGTPPTPAPALPHPRRPWLSRLLRRP